MLKWSACDEKKGMLYRKEGDWNISTREKEEMMVYVKTVGQCEE